MGKQQYSLKWSANPPLALGQLVTFAIAAGVGIILAWLGVIGVPGGAVGVSALYVAMGFLVPFILWFSGWGLVIALLAGIIGAGVLAGMPLNLAIVFGLVDLVSGIPILLCYRLLAPRLGVDPLGKDVFAKRGFIFFFLVVCVFTRLISSAYGNGVLYFSGLMPANALPIAFLGWFIGDLIVTLVISPVLLRALTPVIERFGLAVKGLWT